MSRGRGLPVKDEELHGAAAPLVGPAVVDADSGSEPGHARRAGRKPMTDGACVPRPSAATLPSILSRAPPALASTRTSPYPERASFHFSAVSFVLARRPDQPRLDPVGPVAADPVARVRDDEPQLLRALEVDVDVHRASGRGCRDRLAIEQRLRIGGRGRGRAEGQEQRQERLRPASHRRVSRRL